MEIWDTRILVLLWHWNDAVHFSNHFDQFVFVCFFGVLTRFRLFDRHTFVQLWFNTSEWGGIIFRHSTQGNRGVTERQHGESFRGLKYLLTQLPTRLKCQEWGKIRRSCQISYIALFQTSCVVQLIPHPTNIRYKTANRFDLVLERTGQSLRNYARRHKRNPILNVPSSAASPRLDPTAGPCPSRPLGSCKLLHVESCRSCCT